MVNDNAPPVASIRDSISTSESNISTPASTSVDLSSKRDSDIALNSKAGSTPSFLNNLTIQMDQDPTGSTTKNDDGTAESPSIGNWGGPNKPEWRSSASSKMDGPHNPEGKNKDGPYKPDPADGNGIKKDGPYKPNPADVGNIKTDGPYKPNPADADNIKTDGPYRPKDNGGEASQPTPEPGGENSKPPKDSIRDKFPELDGDNFPKGKKPGDLVPDGNHPPGGGGDNSGGGDDIKPRQTPESELPRDTSDGGKASKPNRIAPGRERKTANIMARRHHMR